MEVIDDLIILFVEWLGKNMFLIDFEYKIIFSMNCSKGEGRNQSTTREKWTWQENWQSMFL